MQYLVGIDEAGRGPIAGPVSVAIFYVEKKLQRKLLQFFPDRKVKDSKKLSERNREIIFKKITEAKESGDAYFQVVLTSARIIDTKGISFAIKNSIEKMLEKSGLEPKKTEIRLDGSLKAPIQYKNQKTIIKGDEKEAVIALASIVAKVTRDKYMKKIAVKFPNYKFEIHKGYGTKKHYESIAKFGLSTIHRKSFLTKILV
jgi:ribonuclease HII